MDAAIGFVVAKGDPVERARLSWLRAGAPPDAEVLAKAELGQAAEGGWPAVWGQPPSVDATCFHLAELDDLGALGRPAARRALDWLASRQQPDGSWEEDEALAPEAPAWARPGDPEARLLLTASAAFWLTVADLPAPAGHPPNGASGGYPIVSSGGATGGYPIVSAEGRTDPAYRDQVAATAQVIIGSLRADGTWPSFLAYGWLAGAVLYRYEAFYESARMQLVLGDRLAGMSPADVAWLAATLRRVGLPDDEWLLVAARQRLAATQRSDGGWASDAGPAFDVHTTLTAIRACRPR
jgi:hypothetical protein